MIDLEVERRLGEPRLIALVVPEAAIPDEVDNNVLVELLPIRACQPDDRQARLRVVGVHMWTTGMPKPFATSLENGVERPLSASVVKPTWLLQMM